MKKLVSAFISLVLVVSLAPNVAFADASSGLRAAVQTESGENVGNAIVMDVNKVYSLGNGTVWYRFELEKPGIVSVDFGAPSAGHTKWRVSLYKLGYDVDELYSKEFRPSELEWQRTLPVGLDAGTYFVQVTDLLLSADVYTCSVRVNFKQTQACEKEFNDDYLTATDLKLGITYQGYRLFLSDKDYYKFVVTDSGKVKFNLDIDSVSGYYLTFDILDYWNNSVYSENTYNTRASNVSTVLSMLPGTYYVLVDNSGVNSDDVPGYALNVDYVVSKPKVKKVASLNGGITVKWGKVPYATGYQVKYSENSNFKSSKVVNVSAKKTGKKITELKKKKRYFVRVRAIQKANGKTYHSSWTSVKTLKIK